MNRIAFMVMIMLAALAAAPAHADIESERMAIFEQQKWWVGKNLEVGDVFVYELCDPDAFSGLYGGQPWFDRCYHVSLHFVTLLLDGVGPKWMVQAVFVDGNGGRTYNVYSIDAGTMGIDGLRDDRRMANAVQRTIFGLTEFTGNGGKPLIVGESWGTAGASSPAVEFVVREVVAGDDEREVFLAGYTATTATSVHRILLDEPFPRGAEVYNPHRLQSGPDRLYSYDLVWSGNSIRDDMGTNEWYDAIGDTGAGGFADYSRPAPDPGAGVFDLCALDDPESDGMPGLAESGIEINVGSGVPVEAAGVGQPDDTEAFVDAIDDVEYCADLLDFEGYALVPPEQATVIGPDHAGQPELNGLTEDELFDFPQDPGIQPEDGLFDFPQDIDGIQPEDVPGLEPEHFGPSMPDSPMHETVPNVPADIVLKDARPKETAMENIPGGVAPEAAGAGATDEAVAAAAATSEDGLPFGMSDWVPGFFDWISGFFEGIGGGVFGEIAGFFEGIGGGVFGEIAGFFEGIGGGVFDDLVGVFAMPAAHAQSDDGDDDDNDDNVVQRLLDIIAGNGTADDIRDGILAEIPGVQGLLQQSRNNDGLTLSIDDSVWIPTKMIEGLTYEGMVLLDDAANDPRTIMLVSSDRDVLSVERAVTVQAGRNSAIFEVVANSGGTARVYAALGGKSLATDDGTVYEVNTAPFRIMLVAPGSGGSSQDGIQPPPDDAAFPDDVPFSDATSSTEPARTTVSTDAVPVFIYVLDQNGAPARVETDTVLSLGASAGIRVPETVVIQAGTNHAKIVAGVDRSGMMHAASPSLQPGTMSIDRVADAADVRLAVAPTVIAEGSAAYYYVWLEKDGRPYTPKHAIDVQLVSTDRSVAGFGRAHTDMEIARHVNADTVRDSVVTIQMSDGLARGLVYTGGAGIATLTASISQHGTASYGVRVGPAGISDAWLCGGESGIALGRPGPTNLVMWLMPRVTDSVAYAVVAQYHIANAGDEPEHSESDSGGQASGEPAPVLTEEEQQTQELLAGLAALSLAGSGREGAEGCVATPVPFTEQYVTVSSDGGAMHDGTYGTLHQYGIRGAAIEFPIEFQTTGEHTVRVTGNEIGAFDETEDLFGSWTDADEWAATILVENAHVDDYSLGITPLPFDSDGPGEVAMVYLRDGQGSMVDANSIRLRTGDLVLSQAAAAAAAAAASDFGIDRYSHAFVLTAGLNKTGDVSVSTAAIPPVSQRLVPADEVIGTHIDVPGAVHAGEEFPYAIHEINSNGVPLRLMDAPDVSLGYGIVESSGSGSRLVTEDSGATNTITVIGAGEPVTETVEVGKNKLDFEVDVDAGAGVRVGEPVLLRLISDVAGIDYTVSWPSWAEHERVGDGVYEVIPVREINGTISVIGEKRGYGTGHGSVDISAVHEVDVAAKAEAGGRSIPVKPEITNAEDGSRIDAPYTGPPIHAHVKYPRDYTTQTGEGYLFAGMEINGAFYGQPELELYLEVDARFMGMYERQIFVDIADAEGGGVYRPGEEVRVSAPDREKVSFLITETFSHWEGDLSGEKLGSLTFEASEDIHAVAVYEEVHGWMGIAFAAAATVTVLAVFRKSDRLKWMFAGLAGLGKMRPKGKPKKKKKTTTAKPAKGIDPGSWQA